jgi:hypothetical protein
MKPIVCITTIKKNIQRINAIENTYAKILKTNNIPYFYVSADKIFNLPQINLNFIESYEQLPTKTFLLFKELLNYDYTHLIKLDDDTYFNYNAINFNLQDYDYVGKFNDITDCSKEHYYKVKKEYRQPKRNARARYAEGGCYFLSKKAINFILEYDISYFQNNTANYRGEDVVIGELLYDKNIKTLDIKSEFSESLNMDITKNYISIHPLHYSLFNDIFENKQDCYKLLVDNAIKNDYNKKKVFLKKYE